MEKKFGKVKNQINKILKKIGDSTCDWTIQISENSANPGRITYGCMIHISDRFEPLTFVCNSMDELEEALKEATKGLNREMIDLVYYQGEVERCERLKNYYAEKIAELSGES